MSLSLSTYFYRHKSGGRWSFNYVMNAATWLSFSRVKTKPKMWTNKISSQYYNLTLWPKFQHKKVCPYTMAFCLQRKRNFVLYSSKHLIWFKMKLTQFFCLQLSLYIQVLLYSIFIFCFVFLLVKNSFKTYLKN